MSKPIYFLSPAGRLVMGHPMEAQDKDAEKKPLVIKNGPNAGEPRVNYFVGLAISKDDPGLAEFEAGIKEAAMNGFPGLFDDNQNCTLPSFAFKTINGDSETRTGTGPAPKDKEGFPGCKVFRFGTGYPAEIYDETGKRQLTDKAELKRGDYIRIEGSAVDNGSTNKPGVYLNYKRVQRCGFGQEISSGPTAEEVFGDERAPLPKGASAAPVTGGMPSNDTGSKTEMPTRSEKKPLPKRKVLEPEPRTFDQRLTPKASGYTWAELSAPLPDGGGYDEESAIDEGILLPE